MKILQFLALIATSLSPLKAASITISGGFGTQGIYVREDLFDRNNPGYGSGTGELVDYKMSVGGWSGSEFTQFGYTVQKPVGQKIYGSFTATAPASLSNQPIYILIESRRGFVLLSTPIGEVFPDVTSVASNSVNASSPSIIPVAAKWAHPQSGDFFFRDVGTAINIVGYSDEADGVAAIPASINGKPVVAIEPGAFSSSIVLRSAVIPESVTTIGTMAFRNCTNLTSVSLGSGISGIAEETFAGCSSLTSIVIPGNVTSVGVGAFRNCTSLTSVSLGSGITGIAEETFAGCSSLTRIVIPGNVTSVGAGAFVNCTNLASAVFLGPAPLMGSNVFYFAASGFTVYYLSGAQGFSTPSWQGYTAYPRQTPQFTSSSPPATGRVGLAYYHPCTATGLPVASFAVTSGALPDGLTITSGGTISGIPTVPGTFTGAISASNGFVDDAVQAFSIQIRDPLLFTSGGENGTITGGGSHEFNTTAILSAFGNPGYVFVMWSGDAAGSDNPLSVLMDSDKTVTAVFGPDTTDDDEDGLTNYQEIVEYGTDPALADTDVDGVEDGDDAFPLNPAETLDTDGDGTGDNADLDDDGDGLPDADELTVHGTNPKRADSDGDGLRDKDELEVHFTNPLNADHDGDGLSDGAEFLVHQTGLKDPDSDDDGFLDGYEVVTGKLPLDAVSRPALVAEARTSIELTFPTALGRSYRIEASTDLATWTVVESGIAGSGGQIQRFYTTRNLPKRYFRVEEEEP